MSIQTAESERSSSQTVKAQLSLRDLILSGELKPGDRISELSVVERLGISRTPIRMALVRLEEEGLPRGVVGESCAIMAYLCNKHGLDQFYPTDPARRAMVDNAMFYLIGTVYPLVARATYPTLGFGQYPGEVATSEAGEEMKEKARADAEAALAEPLEVYNRFFLAGQPFIGGKGPSIADMRFAATLEFLRAIDYPFPQWAEEYMSRMEESLGEAYSEPAADVRGYVESVKTAATA